MKKMMLVLLVLSVFLLSSCSKKELLIVTTTSLQDSGLLDYILPYFEEEYGVFVKVVAVGTGAALELGEMGEADILLVHAYDSEIEFVNNGYGEKRSNVMYNDFIIVGPEVLNGSNLEEILNEIKENHTFYSRGDNSGTHKKELSLWATYHFDVEGFGDWYKETGQGMGSTLTMTSLSQYYTLSDRSTYLSMKDTLELVISYENPVELINQYGVIKVNPSLHN
ncbi:MAG: substrate-binding domain-containing protein, partial [Firmicutes bacterium]|nr:substrate-binding domain-containing protein [Bacillota bacterium]